VRAVKQRSRAQLVLLRGGRSDAPPDASAVEDAAWRALSSRIGWSEDVPALPDDYEARMAEKIFGVPRFEASSELARAVEPCWDAAASPSTAVSQAGFARRRAWLASSVFFVAAAAAALAWVVAREESPSVAPREVAPAAPPATPNPSTPTEESPVRDPGATSVADRLPSDGAAEDRGESRPRGRERTLASKVPTRGRSRAATDSRQAHSAGVTREEGGATKPTHAAESSLSLALLEHATPVLSVEDAAPLGLTEASSVDTLEPWVDLPSVTKSQGASPVGWSLAPNRERWIGVSGASPGEMPAASGVGFVAQIELANAMRF
jgi:hypothetical protein